MIRRIIDILFATIDLVTFSPLFFLISIGVVLQDGGHAFHRSTRVGKDKRLFRLWKFRTMAMDASTRGPALTVQNDPRITFLEKWLRRTKLDELPQLINVFIGEMSLVGPRPEDPRYVASYNQDQLKLLNVRPGITSPASLRFRKEEQLLSHSLYEKQYLEEILPKKLAIDLDYFEPRSIFSDVKLMIRTVVSPFTP